CDWHQERRPGTATPAPDHVGQRGIAEWPYPEGLPIHSIIGNEDGTEPAGSDGIVPYASAHLDCAVSEKVVHAGHNVQVEPETTVELRRILSLHLKEFEGRAASPAGVGAKQ